MDQWSSSQLVSIEHPERTFFWTAPVSDIGEVTTEDPIGLDYVAQQVGLLLLPALTTRSTRAQAYVMVLYGLALAERAVEAFGYAPTEEAKRQAFERWERFWALATLEYRGGTIPRGDWDSMRGIRGAKTAWRVGGEHLPLEFQLISRQQELGHLGAYLVPLRRSGLVTEGGRRPTPAALEILDAFWDEAGENKHRSRYDEYAMAALEPNRARIERKRGNLTLAKVGEHSRLLSLIHRGRVPQQQRLYAALFERARDPHTHRVTQLIESAVGSGVTSSREVLDNAIAGRLGDVASNLHELLVTARAFGDFMQHMVAAFDRAYATIDRGGWIVGKEQVASASFGEANLVAIQDACKRLLDAPAVGEIRRFPMHGAPCLRLAADLTAADAGSALELLLAYHAGVQRSRRRGAGWIHEEGGKLVLRVTSYTARPEAARYPSFKFDAVRTLLTDLGRLPYDRDLAVEEVGA